MDYPIVNIPGSRDWQDAWEMGKALDWLFPNQGGVDLAYAICYNGLADGVDTLADILNLEMIEEGERDAGSWVWRITLPGGIWLATGWCDYTGWDCQSGLDWKKQ